jgi:hypothetical protein
MMMSNIHERAFYITAHGDPTVGIFDAEWKLTGDFYFDDKESLLINEFNSTQYPFEGEFIDSVQDLKYALFTRSNAKVSGLGVVKVYEYLKDLGIDITKELEYYNPTK